MSGTSLQPQVNIEPVRWWQVADFLRLNFAVVKDVDPWARRILARPWSLPSLFTYIHMLRVFPASAAYFIVVDGMRAGVVWMMRRREHIFVLSVGLLRGLQKPGITARFADFVEEHARREGCEALVAAVAPTNRAVRWLMMARGGRQLGLSTTRLMLSPAFAPSSPQRPPRIVRVGRAEAPEARKRWRLHEVEYVAGRAGRSVADDFLEPMPQRSRYYTLYDDDREIGFAWARRLRRGELEIGLFPEKAFWAGPETANLLAALASHLGGAVHRLVVTTTHADALAASAPFQYERLVERERHIWFKPVQ